LFILWPCGRLFTSFYPQCPTPCPTGS